MPRWNVLNELPIYILIMKGFLWYWAKWFFTDYYYPNQDETNLKRMFYTILKKLQKTAEVNGATKIQQTVWQSSTHTVIDFVLLKKKDWAEMQIQFMLKISNRQTNLPNSCFKPLWTAISSVAVRAGIKIKILY